MSTIYTIYRAINTANGKSYIGFDSNWPARKTDHKRDKTKKNAFYNAIRKYGWEAFNWEVLYQSKDKHHTLNEAETHFIKEYNTFKKDGYNMTLGGEGALGTISWNTGIGHVAESCDKMSKTKKALFATGELIPWNKGRKMGISPNKGKKGWFKHTDESKKRMSEQRKGKPTWNKGLSGYTTAKKGQPSPMKGKGMTDKERKEKRKIASRKYYEKQKQLKINPSAS